MTNSATTNLMVGALLTAMALPASAGQRGWWETPTLPPAVFLAAADQIASEIEVAKAAKQRGDNRLAVDILSRLIEQNPDLAQAYNERGMAYNRLGLNDEALSDLNRAIALQPRGSAHYYHRGNIYFDLRQFERAIADYTQAIRFQPKFAGFYHARCLAHDRLGRRTEAIADCKQALTLDPGHARARRKLESLGASP